MGERGTGKSLVLRSVIRQMREDNPKQPLTEVYLNGFCVRDDSAALREIARQLQRASGGGGSAAEAAARDALAAKSAAHVPRTFAESMAELRTALEHTVGASGSKAGRGRPIVLVLDEYDQFAAQNRQVFVPLSLNGRARDLSLSLSTYICIFCTLCSPACIRTALCARARVYARCCCTTCTT